jgi:hypothetical protein
MVRQAHLDGHPELVVGKTTKENSKANLVYLNI